MGIWFPNKIKNWHITVFIINYILMAYVLELAYKRNKRILDGTPETEEEDKKFRAFRRHPNELKWFSRYWQYLFVWTLSPCILISCGLLLTMGLLFNILNIGHDSKNKITGLRNLLYSWSNWFLNRCFLLAVSNVVSVKNKRVEICYKKYLGPDWKPDYDMASTIVNNHNCFLDPSIHALFRTPCFVMKPRDAKNVFIMG